jgi:branched-chain amino acid transport system ATP-binding protein
MVVTRIFEVIKDSNQRGTTILVVEQNASIAQHIADYGYLLENR